MELLLFFCGSVFGVILTVGFFDIKNTIKEETIQGVERNDKIFRVLRNFIEKEHPEILEKLKNSI